MHEPPEELVLLLLKEGNRTEAIKLYEEEMGVTYGEARQLVVQLAQQHGLGQRLVSTALSGAILALLALCLGLLFAF